MSIRRSATAVLVFLAAAWLWPAFAAQAQTPSADLGVIILPDALPGFEPVVGAPGVPDGPVDVAELAELAPGGGEELTEEERRSIQGFGRTWADRNENLIILVLYRLPRLVDAQLFFAGVNQAMHQQFDDVSTFPIPSIPGANGQSFRPDPSAQPANQIVYRKGTIVMQLLVLSDSGTAGRPQAIALAERQAARMPAGSTGTAEGSDDSTSFGVELVAAIAVALLMLGIATLATRSARKKREAPKPPPVPGTLSTDEPPAPFPAPQRVDPAMIRGLRRRTQAVMLLLGISGALAVTSAIVDVGLIDRVTRIKEGRAVNLETLLSLEDLHNGIAIAVLIGLVVTGIAWLLWQHRAQRILGLLQEEPLRFTPAASVGWWLVPLANLVMPFRTMSELYRGSAAPSSSTARAAGPRLLLAIWWFVFIATSILGRVMRTLDDSLDELVLQSRLLAAIDLGYLFAAATAIGVVMLIFGGLKSRAAVEPPAPLTTAEEPAGV